MRGYTLADTTRKTLGLSAGPVSDKKLANLLEIEASVLKSESADGKSIPVGLAIRDPNSVNLKLLFHRKLRESRRFEAARFLGDCIQASASDHWLPVTEFKTARQKMQRAFAAELLCPAAELREFLDNDFSDERVNEAGEYFQVSPLIVGHQVENRLFASYSM